MNKIKKSSINILYFIILILLFFLNYWIVTKIQNYDRNSIIIDIVKTVKILLLIAESYSVILFVLLIGLLFLYKKTAFLRSNLKTMLIITFIVYIVLISYIIYMLYLQNS